MSEKNGYALELLKKLAKYLDNNDEADIEYIKSNVEIIELCLDEGINSAAYKIGDYALKNKGLVEITDRSYVQNRGWIYGISYCGFDKESFKVTAGGGGSFWWNENDLKPITDHFEKLILENHKLNESNRNYQAAVRNNEKLINALYYAMRICQEVPNEKR